MGIKIDVEPGSAADNLLQMKVIPLDSEVTAKNALAHSFRTLLLNMNMSVEKFDELMNKFVDEELEDQSFEDLRTAKISLRGNLRKELANAEMTWHVYCKGLKMLGLKTVHLAVYGTGEGVELSDANVKISL